MNIKKQRVTFAGSCDFCDRSRLTDSGYSLSYPYDEVYKLSGNGLGANICPDCAKQLMTRVAYEEL